MLNLRQSSPFTNAMVIALISAWISPGVVRAETWEQSTPYYEKDAWYDISEWLDSNDYNPTDERIGVWDDEIYDSDVSDSDSDNDDWALTDDSHYQNSGDSSYGTTVQHQKSADRDVYHYAAEYFDYDGDGQHDAMRSYHDTNQDGRYDSIRFYSFNETGDARKPDAQESAELQSQSSKRRRVEGEIIEKRTNQVQGKKHTLVVVQPQDGNKRFLVDLGQESKLGGLNLSKGDLLSAQGPVIKHKGRQIMLAQQLRANEKSHRIDRSHQQISGTVKDTRTFRVQKSDQQLAILAGNDGTKVVVDLGPKDRLPLDLQNNDQLTVKGASIVANDQRIVMAFQFLQDGKWRSIDRGESDNSQRPDSQSHTRQQ